MFWKHDLHFKRIILVIIVRMSRCKETDSREADAVNKESDAACSVLVWNKHPRKLKEDAIFT